MVACVCRIVQFSRTAIISNCFGRWGEKIMVHDSYYDEVVL